MHSCSPIKPKRERELTKEIVRNTQKFSAVRQNILSPLVRESANLEVIEDKAQQLLDRTRLNKLRNNKTEPNKFIKLIEFKQKYEKIFFNIQFKQPLNKQQTNVRIFK